MRYGLNSGFRFSIRNGDRAKRGRERDSSAAIQISGLQVVISAILKAIGPLVNIALLLLFAIIIFAIVGLEFYAGALNSTCYDITDLSKCDGAFQLCSYFFCSFVIVTDLT